MKRASVSHRKNESAGAETGELCDGYLAQSISPKRRRGKLSESDKRERERERERERGETAEMREIPTMIDAGSMREKK